MEQPLELQMPLLSLQPYPNKQLLCRSKIAKFNSNSQLFEQRCALLTEVWFLLLRLQAEERPVYLSKTMYLNFQGLLFMLYSFDDKFKDRLRLVHPGCLIRNIVNISSVIFNWEEMSGETLEDLELREMFKGVKKIVMDFIHLQESNRGFEEQEEMQEEGPFDELVWTQNKLQNSTLFKEYCFPLKYESVVLLKPIFLARNRPNNQLLNNYIQLLDTQERFFRAMIYDANFRDIFTVYGDKMINYFKLMEADNYLTIMNCQEEFQKQKKKSQSFVFLMHFSTKLRKMECSTFITKDNSSESSGNNGSEEEKETITAKKDYREMLDHLKNQIHFKIIINFNQSQKEFKVDIEGESQWSIDEYYYNFLLNLWTQFINMWYSSSFQRKDELEEGRTYKFYLQHKQKNPTISSRFYLTDRNLFREIISVVDRIVILFLLFENTLKNLYKANYNLKEYQKMSLDHIENKVYLEGMVALYGKVIKEYIGFENGLSEVDRQYLKK